MAKLRKLWRFSSKNSDLNQQLANRLGVSTVLAQILINRGFTDEKSAYDFLYSNVESLHDPFLMKDMKRSIERIKGAIKKQELITVYGDYDVDGITSTSLMYRVLKELGAEVNFYIPDRQNEGYGLNCLALEKLQASGTRLLITVDCGISAIEEVRHIGRAMDIIISDHHQPPDMLPDAYAILNPKQSDCTYPEKNLAGVGVAFKLCQALCCDINGSEDKKILSYLDLVALGSIADIVPLTGENRIIVKLGLDQISVTENIGLKALLNVCGIQDNNVDAGKVGFVIAPRLNAAGRTGEVEQGVELLITENEIRANEIAYQLNEENSNRQIVESKILEEAQTLVDSIDLATTKVLVLSGDNWHSGVIGIVASRLVDKYYRPVVIISEKDGIGKGSCRSIHGLDIYNALNECSDILIKYGGHRLAAGLSIEQKNIPLLRERLNAIAKIKLQEEDYIPKLHIDASVALEEINSSFIEQLACLAPHGMGNPKPVFACENLTLQAAKILGRDGRHLKMTVRKGNDLKNVISWEMGYLMEQLSKNDRLDIAFFPEFNEWQGKRTIQLLAQDVRVNCEKVSSTRNVTAERDAVGYVYLTLKRHANSGGEVLLTEEEISRIVSNSYKMLVSEQGVKISVKILSEIKLINLVMYQNHNKIKLIPPPDQKIDILKSPTFCSGNLLGHIGTANIH